MSAYEDAEADAEESLIQLCADGQESWWWTLGENIFNEIKKGNVPYIKFDPNDEGDVS